MLREDRVACRALEWRNPAQQLVQDDAKPVDVGLLGEGGLLDLFRRQVLRRRIGVDEPLELARVAQARQLDIQQLDATVPFRERSSSRPSAASLAESSRSAEARATLALRTLVRRVTMTATVTGDGGGW
jgi:hypothetical protein